MPVPTLIWFSRSLFPLHSFTWLFQAGEFPSTTNYICVSATPARRWKMWKKWLQALPGTRLKTGSLDVHPVDGNETSKRTSLRENSEHILQEPLALLITRASFPYDRNTEGLKAVPCRRKLAKAQMPLCSSGSACPWAPAAFGKPSYPAHSHSCISVILPISLPHVLAAIISPFDLFGCAFVLLSAAVALPLVYKQELSSAAVVFCFIFINAVHSQRKGGDRNEPLGQ